MIIALFALSTVMIVGGIAAVAQGFPYVRLESGLAMVIAGATVASAGAVLLGIAVLAGRVRRVELALGAARPARAEEAAIADPPRRPAPRSEPPAEAVPFAAPAEPIPVQRPSLAAAAGFSGLTATGAPVVSESPAPARTASEPTFAEPVLTPDASEPLLPDLLPPVQADRPTGVPALVPDPARSVEEPSTQPEAPAADLFAVSGPPASGTSGATAPPAPDNATVEPVAPAPFTAHAPATTGTEPGLQVVGTYASGGNTYVMFSNGSIEAETPRGRYTFDSLDELKAFVEAGGENDTRGAA